jgi:hypothetical protein
MEPLAKETQLLEDEQLLAEVEADLRRHRVMKGHPPEGPIFQMPSKQETERRIKALNERVEQSNARIRMFMARPGVHCRCE